MGDCQLLTNHARVLLNLAVDSDLRMREIAERLHVSVRAAYSIVTDLVAAGYVTKRRDGRRNRYVVHRDVPLRDAVTPGRTVGDVLDLFSDAKPRRSPQPVGNTGKRAGKTTRT